LVCALACAVLSQGCAARRGHFADRFVKPGQPATTYDSPTAKKPADTLQDYARRVSTLQAHARPKSSLLPTIESQNPALAASLLKLAIYESAANHREVAAEYRAAGINDYAYRHLQKAIQLDPCDAAAYDALARLWRDWGRPELALGDSYRAVHCNPSSPEIYNTLGTVFLALEQRANAEGAFERALELSPRAAFALSNLCYLALDGGDIGAARQRCEAALAVEPTLAAARNNLALADAMEGNVARAEERLMAASRPWDAYFNVGVLRMSLGKYQQAADAFDRAYNAKPTMWIARDRAAQARRAAATLEQSSEDADR
jgi:tetratricopeptide (TPR) repeat protein